MKRYSDAQFLVFHQHGLPELHRLATEHGVTIAELIQDLHATQELYYEETKSLGARDKSITLKNFAQNFEGIENLIGKSKLKANHYVRLDSVMKTLQMAGQFAARLQLARDGTTRINPFEMVDREYVAALISAIEDGWLDDALPNLAGWAARSTGRAPLPRPTGAAPSVELDTEPEPPTFPEDDPPAGPKVIDVLVERSEPANDLAEALKSAARLRPDVDYFAVTARGIALNLRLDPYLAKQAEGNHEASIRRLLRAVLVGSERAGIKFLRDIGPRIVEVTGVFHGHKRLIGCLNGSRLRLMHMVDIKDQRNTYFKRIPSNLCDEL